MSLRNEAVAFEPPQREQRELRPANGNYPSIARAQLGGLSQGLGEAPWTPVLLRPNANLNVRRGAIEGFVRTCERWKLSQAEQVLLLGYGGDERAAQPIFMGRTRPSQDIRDRTGYVLSISIGLAALYNDSIDAEIDWLRRPHATLGGATPLDFMLDGRMLSMIRVHDLVMIERGL
ncbi:antitoxin Xre/MbcA/ParS toxin-binding domain-containing protein [Bradyrhizobium sp. 17]|uniref:antitoxin Xre/MbcA/ParS toxin-binding domain-containing protein n=1 Tax=Bradyrhizobium sp. 17 TaxID=2782649 RepID=UPI001FF9BBB4|nr:antitoxin Xre/MbcA/ParS toxin-binding domain-containing protein [Bradyrhizobium sp. 17]MCK1523043.1 DUF2384 domain-containing protein [Bradyrhizobium sp. 17]